MLTLTIGKNYEPAQYCLKTGTDQRNRTENPETNPYSYGQLICNEPTSHNGKTASSTNGAGITGYPHAKE